MTYFGNAKKNYKPGRPHKIVVLVAQVSKRIFSMGYITYHTVDNRVICACPHVQAEISAARIGD